MSDERSDTGNSVTSSPSPSNASVPAQAQVSAAPAAPEKLEALEDLDFLLEEIENKIAPLALA